MALTVTSDPSGRTLPKIAGRRSTTVSTQSTSSLSRKVTTSKFPNPPKSTGIIGR